MSTQVVVVEGTVTADGTLEVQEKVNLPAGKVQVTLVPMPELPGDDPFWQLMQNIWQGQRARGHIPRSALEVEAEREAMRQEWDEPWPRSLAFRRKRNGPSSERARMMAYRTRTASSPVEQNPVWAEHRVMTSAGHQRR